MPQQLEIRNLEIRKNCKQEEPAAKSHLWIILPIDPGDCGPMHMQVGYRACKNLYILTPTLRLLPKPLYKFPVEEDMQLGRNACEETFPILFYSILFYPSYSTFYALYIFYPISVLNMRSFNKLFKWFNPIPSIHLSWIYHIYPLYVIGRTYDTGLLILLDTTDVA